MDGQELMRVYGALMWSLGKVVLRKYLGMQMYGLSGICYFEVFAFSIDESQVLVAPEVPRVYIGSW